jgi:uncharacterized delta-60 repeat protein
MTRRGSGTVIGALAATATVVAFLVATPTAALAAPGDLDTTFSGDGIVTSTHHYQGAKGGPVAIDSQGRIVVASETSIERYMPNGTPDMSFANYGQASIVAAGWDTNPADPHGHDVFAVKRLKANGAPDPSFSGDGCVLTPIGGTADDDAYGVTIDPAGRIVVSGSSFRRNPPGGLFAVARYMPDGSPDKSFSWDGQVRTEFPGVTWAHGGEVGLDSKGRIVQFGSADGRFAVARYGPRGGLDPSFSGDGMVTTQVAGGNSFGYAMTIDDSDRILVGGTAHLTDSSDSSDLALARYRPNGALDQSFSGDGKVFTSFGRDRQSASDLAIDSQGRLVVSAAIFDADNTRSAFALARYSSAGALDRTFSGDGRVTTPTGGFSVAGGVTLDPAGRIVVGGHTSRATGGDPRIAVARYLGG